MHRSKQVHILLYIGTWKQKGCFLNKAPKLALPDSFDKNVAEIQGIDNKFEYCKEKAETFGYKAFGVDDKNCWSGDNAESTFAYWGKSSGCTVSKKGNGAGSEVNGNMFVYRLE